MRDRKITAAAKTRNPFSLREKAMMRGI